MLGFGWEICVYRLWDIPLKAAIFERERECVCVCVRVCKEQLCVRLLARRKSGNTKKAALQIVKSAKMTDHSFVGFIKFFKRKN